MYISLTTGQDSLRAYESSPRRNVSVLTFVNTNEEGIIPLFSAYQKKLRGFAVNDLVSVIPATNRFVGATAGSWYLNRYEVARGTEILIEYRSRKSTGFSESVDYLMLVADPNSALWKIRIDLPAHELSAVPHLFYEGRFSVISKDSELPETSVEKWKRFLTLDDEYHVSDILDPNQEEHAFKLIELESAVAPTVKVDVVKGVKGGKRQKIRRIRKIKI